MTFHQSQTKCEAACHNTDNVKVSTVHTEKSTQVSSHDFSNTESQEAVSSVKEMCFQTETETNKSRSLEDGEDQPVSSQFDNDLNHSAHCKDIDKSNQEKEQDNNANTEVKNIKCSEIPSEIEQKEEDQRGKHESKVISEAATCVQSSESAPLSTCVSQKNIHVSECRTACNGESTKVQLEHIKSHNVRRSQTDTVQNDFVSPQATTEQKDNTSPDATILTETLKSEKESDKTCGEPTRNNHQKELDDDDDLMIIEKDVIIIEIDDDLIEPGSKDKSACNTCQQEEPFYTIEENDSPDSNEMAYDMECENIVEPNTNNDKNEDTEEFCDVNGISSLKITSVIGSLNMNKNNKNDRNRTQETSELPDGMVIELNIDNEESSDEVTNEDKGTTAEKPAISVRKRVHKGPKFTRVKRNNRKSVESNNQQRSVMLSSTDSPFNLPPESTATSAVVNVIEQQAQPIMIMSNVFNSPVCSAQAVPQYQSGPNPPVNTVPPHTQQQQQREFLQHHSQQQQQLQHYYHQQHPSSEQPDSQPNQHLPGPRTQHQQSQLFHQALLKMPKDFLQNLTRDARSKFIINDRVDFAALETVVHQILQYYPFFHGKFDELCMQLLEQNYRLFTGYKAWKDQNKTVLPDVEPLSVPGAKHKRKGSAQGHQGYEIMMENDADDSRIEPNNSGFSVQQAVFRATLNDNCVEGLNFQFQPNFVTQAVPGSVFSYSPCSTGAQYSIKQPADQVWGMIPSQMGNPVGQPGGYLHPSLKSLSLPLKSLNNSGRVKARVQCATVTSSEAKEKEIRDKKPSISGHSQSKGGRSKPIPGKKKVINPKSLQNLKQNRKQNLQKTFSENVMVATSDTLIKELGKQKVGQKTPAKPRGRPPGKIIKKNGVKGRKKKTEIQDLVGNSLMLGSSERGAKVQAQQKLNLYNEMLDDL